MPTSPLAIAEPLRDTNAAEAKSMVSLLNTGDQFPELQISTAHGLLSLPDDLDGDFSVVLIYRGSWCAYCIAQLASFQKSLPRLAALGIRVVALSVDDAENTAALAKSLHLDFPVGHSADAAAVAEATGAFLSEDPPYLQSTGFVLDPDGRIVVSVYSSGAIGRLVPDDVIGVVRHIRRGPLTAAAS